MRALYKQVFTLLALAVVGFGLMASPVLAANGKISGVVKDKTSGETLPGVNVTMTVGGATVGTTTDGEGRYFLLNVVPGTYSVQASFVGYQAVQQTGVKVGQDLTTDLDFDLSSQAIEGEMLTVMAERPRVEKSQTSSRASIDPSELNNSMPVADLQDLVNTTPSVYRGFVRGGRKSETKILVDGVDVSDTYFSGGEGNAVYQGYNGGNRSSGDEFGAVGVNASSVQSLDIISGTFNAEYDAASAGVINVVTKDGGTSHDGRVFFRTAPGGTKNQGLDVYSDLDKYNEEKATLAASDNPDNVAKANLLTFNQATIDKIGYGDDRPYEAELSLGGPLMGKSSYFATYRFNNNHGLFPGEFKRSMRYSLKLTNRLTDNVKVRANLTIDDGGKLGGWNNRKFSGKMKYFNEGAWADKQLGLMGYLGWTHTLSSKTFYEVKVSNLNRVSEFGYSDDNGDGVVSLDENGGFIIIRTTADVDKYMGVDGSGVRSDGTRAFFTKTPGNDKFNDLNFSGNAYRFGGPGFYYEELTRDVFQIKADLTSQINFNHQIKTGILYRYHTVSQFQQQNRIGGFSPTFPYEENEFEVHPSEYAVYAQDRIEYEGIIINAGVRLDGFDSGAKTFSNIFDPSTEETLANGHVIRRQNLDKDIDTKWTLQPRLGISHPITDNAAMHYSWGKFYSPRSFSNLYENYGIFSNPSLPAMWDSGADPYKATAYEIGLQYGFSNDYLFDIAIYYRDIENYTSTGYSITPAAGNGFGALTYITSFGYADSRGFELSLEKRPGNSMISGRVNYAYSYIKQSVRSGATPFPDKTSYSNAADGGTEIPFDDRYTFNTYEANVNGGGNPLASGFDREHRLTLTLQAALPGEFNATLISSAESGFTFRYQETSTDLRGRETGKSPWSFRSDFRVTRGFKISESMYASGFFEIRNLFDKANIISFDNGDVASRTVWEESIRDSAIDPNPGGILERSFTAQGLSVYDRPREVALGISLDF